MWKLSRHAVEQGAATRATEMLSNDDRRRASKRKKGATVACAVEESRRRKSPSSAARALSFRWSGGFGFLWISISLSSVSEAINLDQRIFRLLRGTTDGRWEHRRRSRRSNDDTIVLLAVHHAQKRQADARQCPPSRGFWTVGHACGKTWGERASSCLSWTFQERISTTQATSVRPSTWHTAVSMA